MGHKKTAPLGEMLNTSRLMDQASLRPLHPSIHPSIYCSITPSIHPSWALENSIFGPAPSLPASTPWHWTCFGFRAPLHPYLTSLFLHVHLPLSVASLQAYWWMDKLHFVLVYLHFTGFRFVLVGGKRGRKCSKINADHSWFILWFQ